MTLLISAIPPPLTADTDGAVRVAGTRVTLDTLVYAFNDGASAEEIARQYPSLSLADVFATLGYYLRQRDEVQAYLRQREEAAEEVRRENETRFPSDGIRRHLLARREQAR